MKQILPTILFCLFSFSGIAQTDSLFGNIYFEFDRYGLTPSASSQLRDLAKVLTTYNSITLTGRTDERGSHLYNDSLSARRITTVINYLITQGLNREQFTTLTALGKRNLLAADVADRSRRWDLNRVVEIRGKANDSKPPVAVEPAPKADPATSRITSAVTIQEQIQEGKSAIVLNNLNFEGGRHLLLPSSQPTLQAVLEVMKNNVGLEVEIRGHVCCSAVNEDGLDLDTGEKLLSRNRAREIYLYLINNGIPASRLSYKGMGGSQKIVAEEITEEDRTTNRRVEFVIIKR